MLILMMEKIMEAFSQMRKEMKSLHKLKSTSRGKYFKKGNHMNPLLTAVATAIPNGMMGATNMVLCCLKKLIMS